MAKRVREAPHLQARRQGFELVRAHPLLGHLAARAHVVEDDKRVARGWAGVLSSGTLVVNPKKVGTPEEWAWVFAHLLLHLGFGHFPPEAKKHAWNAACDVVIAAFLHGLKLGRCPAELALDPELFGRSERALYDRFVLQGVPPELAGSGCADPGSCDLLDEGTPAAGGWPRASWQDLLADGLRRAVTDAVDVAAGALPGKSGDLLSVAERARRWFMASYPLLGALASSFRLVEDLGVCRRLDIQVAAVSEVQGEIYVNPMAKLTDEEARFVLGHELLHVGLRHDGRRQGRDAYLWNVACDFVVNQWLVDLGVGHAPQFGLLLDGSLKTLSAESVYDLICNDLRKFRRLATLRGVGAGDILDGVKARGDDVTDLDAFYRRCLAQGLLQHGAQGRGLVPAGLVEEIWALAEPPIPWDVALARLFDAWFPPLETRRTYARPSRRQSSTPDIPRPRAAPVDEGRAARTFAVVFDTSASMERALIARALGAIASYAMARDVPLVRLVYCDAAPYDEGYVAPEQIEQRMKVRGRGGTVLQPGIDLVERAEDFPAGGPILVITDGLCDALHVKREHAYLMPKGSRLPFPPRGPVFYVE